MLPTAATAGSIVPTPPLTQLGQAFEPKNFARNAE